MLHVVHDKHSDRFGYRPALDGLRAVAVLAVIVYHLGYPWFPGGFIGVDVFFVLSGYLITSLLLVERERSGGIALGAFWLRRARRLIPALLLLLLVVALWVGKTTLPSELWLRRADIFWTLFYGANWHFIASGQDYFAQGASASPLRHTWSLAIEEQFYIVWPLLVAGVAVLTSRLRVTLSVVCSLGIVLSAAAAAWLFDPGDPSRAYFGTDARIHQLLIGALLAIWIGGRVPVWTRAAGVMSAGIGLLTLVAAFLLLSDRNAAYYFGLSAALAVSAAAVILGVETAPAGLIGAALSWQPVRWIGRISYGLYLWHWPVILAIHSAPGPLSRLPGSLGVNLTRVFVTFGIAVLSFYLIEQPLRRGRALWIGSSAWRFAATSAVAVIAVSATALSMTNAPPGAVVVTDIPGCPGSGDTVCLRREGPAGAPVVALIGDSIARSLDPAMMELARQRRWTYVVAAANGCRIDGLLTTYQGQSRPMDRECQISTVKRWDRLLAEWNPAVIVAMDRWELIDAVGPDGQTLASGTPAHMAETERSLTDTARHLTSKGARLAFIELPPVISEICGAAEKRSLPQCHMGADDDTLQNPYNALFRRVALQVPGAATISLTSALCPNGICAWEISGRVVRGDGLHFTPETSRALAPTIVQQLSAAGMLR
jgi:peptidoglycan/LPS O-acetylase OafA/YrhL